MNHGHLHATFRRAPAWLLWSWLVAALPLGRSVAHAASQPVPSFASPSTDPFGLANTGSFAAPAIVDIDGDGRLDVFVGGAAGDISFFRNTGSRVSPAFSASSVDPFGLTNVGGHACASFADLNHDGKVDALVGDAAGDLVFLANSGSGLSPAFAEGAVDPFGLADVGTYACPALADLDGDGDLDVLAGNGDGNLVFFRNTGTVVSPAFAASSTNPFGLADVGANAAPTFVDLDGDGDLDAVVGRDDGSMVVFTNTGTATSPSFVAETPPTYGLVQAGLDSNPRFADLDGDGDLDALVGIDAGDLLFFQNQQGRGPTTQFAPQVLNPFGLARDPQYKPIPAWVDFDGDGDFDSVMGDIYGREEVFRNTGTAVSPAFGPRTINPWGFTNMNDDSAPAFADMDDDGDLDVFVGAFSGNLSYFQNTGTAASPALAPVLTNPFGLVDVGKSSNPALVDIDGDGDLDLFTGEASGATFFFRNIGTSESPAFAAKATNPFGLKSKDSYSIPRFLDVDGDGDLDLFVGVVNGNTYLFRNTGTATSPAFALPSIEDPFGIVDVSYNSVVTFVDIDQDGDPDAFIADYCGDLHFFENLTKSILFEDGFESGDLSAWTASEGVQAIPRADRSSAPGALEPVTASPASAASGPAVDLGPLGDGSAPPQSDSVLPERPRAHRTIVPYVCVSNSRK